MQASFMAKPFAHQPGNGLHVHMRLVEEAGANRFGADGGEELLGQAIAGMQALMYDCVGLFAPNLNSHRRFLGPFVPTTLDWGHNNRSVAFRIPSSGPSARRIEHRVAGADANPHLVLAAILASVLHGITHRLPATSPVTGKVRGGSADFPDGLLAALDRLEKSVALAEYLPEKYLSLYSDLKRREHVALTAEVFPVEYDFYL
jgi:glutamine synthetase